MAGSGWKTTAGPITVDFTTAAKVDAALKASPARMNAELRVWHRNTSKQVEHWSRAAARGGTPAERRMATAIRGRGTAKAVLLKLEPRGRSAGAIPTFNGSNERTGWNRLNASSRPQFPKPIRPGWEPMKRGEGPYAINDGLAPHRDDIQKTLTQGQLNALARAFPHSH